MVNTTALCGTLQAVVTYFWPWLRFFFFILFNPCLSSTPLSKTSINISPSFFNPPFFTSNFTQIHAFLSFTTNRSSIFFNFSQISSNSPSPSSSSQFQIYSIQPQVLPFSSPNSLFLLPFFSNSTNSSSFCPKFSPLGFLWFFTNYQVLGTQEEDQDHPGGGGLKSRTSTSNKNNSYFPGLGLR